KLREALAVADMVTVLRRGDNVLTAPASVVDERTLIEAMIGTTMLSMTAGAGIGAGIGEVAGGDAVSDDHADDSARGDRPDGKRMVGARRPVTGDAHGHAA